jgi:hypothetical protein
MSAAHDLAQTLKHYREHGGMVYETAELYRFNYR